MDIVLVHGSYHGAWCWDLLRPELERLGHRVITPELPVSDPALGAADYARAVIDAMRADHPAVLVGHSMSGLVLPLVAELQPVHAMVFLASFLPMPGLSANEQRAREPIDGRVPPTTPEWTHLGDDVWMVGPRTATELFFDDVPAELAAWAVDRLRPQAYRVMNEPSPLAAWPAVPSRVIACADDRAINPEWMRSSARERLGVEALEIAGGHSPFLTRPAELAAVIEATL